VAMPMVIIAIVGSSTGRLRASREKNREGLQIEVADFCATASSRRLTGFLASYEHVLVRPLAVPSPQDSVLLSTLQQSRPEGDADARLVIGPQFEAIVRAKTPK
ncbi:MAG: hypothetical protein ACKPJD_02865, partial [Planctomycetaceae bacterium]